MCGIVGYWDIKNKPKHETIRRMSQTISSRGPDDSGSWVDAGAGIALGHRRLSILDLSQSGHQPMQSFCKRFIIIFNGEIYNYKEIKADLEREFQINDQWRGHSDTEVLLAAIAYWGLKIALQKTNGMFAFALWDSAQKVLILARDRLGEKPLYYGTQGTSFLFGSELKPLKISSSWRGEINKEALPLYLRYNYIPAPYSIFKNIYKLLPASYVCIKEAGAVINGPFFYWNISDIAISKSSAKKEDVCYHKKELDFHLNRSVLAQMEADVPLGSFLSGGIDSSAITAIMQRNSSSQIDSFSIGFSEKSHNEAVFAKRVAESIGTHHTEFYVDSNTARDVIPDLPEMWDEPFADASQIPTFLLCQLAQNKIKVALTGDGADELFMGYSRHLKAADYWRTLNFVPKSLQKLVTYIIEEGPLKLGGVSPRLQYKISMLAKVLANLDQTSLCNTLVSHWHNPESGLLGMTEPKYDIFRDQKLKESLNTAELMAYFDLVSYLPDDLLTKIDRASMAVSLETRTPFLDHELVAYSFEVPMSLKIRNGKSKWLLRQVLNDYVPEHLTDRSKMGFSVPLAEWLRGPLKDWAEDLLDEQMLINQGLFNAKNIRTLWDQHKKNKCDWHYRLWSILMFQSWFRKEA